MLAAGQLAAGTTPQLIADVNQQPEKIGAYPTELVAVGGKVFYAAESRVFGRELWMTDGTKTGTRLVKDLCVGQVGSMPSMLRAVGKQVLFFADDGEHGKKLWSSDGETTVMAGGPSMGSGEFVPQQATAAGGLLYFTGPSRSDATFLGRDLWRSDGTAEGTWLLNPVQGPRFPPFRPFGDSRLLTQMKGALFFSNLDRELWRSAGTKVKTLKVADLGDGARIISMVGANGRLWFTVNRGEAKELWSWIDGKAAMISSISAGALDSDGLVARGDRAFFVSSDPKAGVELWTSNGTVSWRVQDIGPGALSSSPSDLTWCGRTLYFTASNGITDRGLWASDGVRAWPVKTWKNGPGPTKLVANGGTLFFLRDEGGEVLWRSDGTVAGTWRVKRVTTPETTYGSPTLIAAGDRLFFQGNDGQSGFELWKSDGTAQGTEMVRDLKGTMDGLIEIEPGGMAAWGDKLVFCGNDGIAGEEPWLSDGTKAGTRMLADIRPGPEDSEPVRMATAGGKLFFDANDGVHGRELWRSDTHGTALVRDINPGSGSASLSELTAFGDRMAFTADDGVDYNGLWITDGDSTVKVKDKASVQMAALGGGLLFAARDAGYNEEPWWTDGETTRLVKELIPGSQGSSPAWFTRVGNEAYFQAYGGAGFGLWRTDGTESATVQVSGWQGPGAVYPMLAAGSRLFFFEEQGTTGLRLWMAENGQAALVRQIGDSGTEYPFPFPATPYMETCNGQLFFVANDGTHGNELWRSDGTPAGTVMVRDIRQGSTGSAPVNLRTVGGTVFFQANDGVRGEELWSTDGTTAGTRLVADIVPGPGGSAPGKMVLAGSRLFFSAVTETTGREAYVLDISSLLEINAEAGSPGLSGLNASSMTVPNGDGAGNLLNYAFGIDGTSPDHGTPTGEPGHLPRISVITDGNRKMLKVEYARRTGSPLIYTARRSNTLEKGSFVPMSGDQLIVPDGDGWERVVQSEWVEGDQFFGVVEVRQP